jgi:type I restriction enzyme S subunit
MIGDASEGSKYITSTKNRIKPEGLKKTRMVREGDFLLTNSMSFGRPYILKTSGCIHDGWLVLSPKDDRVFPDFFYYLLGSESLFNEFSKRAAGAVVKNLNTSIVKGVQIPLPPLPEQKRIAAILDAADALRAKRRESLAQLDALIQSTFLDMFGDPRDSRKAENCIPLGQVATVTMGQSPPGSSYNKLKKGPPLLNGPTEFGIRFPQEVQWTDSPTKICEAGDILFCVRGATAGRLNLADKAYCLGRGVAALRPDKPDKSAFIYAVLHSLYDYFQSSGVGSTFINISKKDLDTLLIPNPPFDSQHRFAAIVESVEKQKARMRTHLAELDTLFAALQSRAFNGELL